MLATSCRRAYDHRMRDLVCEEHDPSLFRHLGVPRSTAASWIRRGPRPVVSAEVLDLDHAELQAEVLALRRRVRFLLAIIRLAFLLVRLSGFRLDSKRVPDGETKRSILAAVASAQKAIPLAVALRVLRLAPARFHAWRSLADNCMIDDRPSCPRDGTAVVADSGGENVNHEVDDLLGLGQLRRVLAQVEVGFSNSMIEAWWRSLKHGWLYLHQLDTFADLERLITFYVEQHNTVVPHSAFAGQTPDEMYFGRGDQVPADLASSRARARAARMTYNRNLSCEACRPPVRDAPGTSDSSAVSGILQMRDETSAMS